MERIPYAQLGSDKEGNEGNPVLIDGRNVFGASDLEGIDYLKIG